MIELSNKLILIAMIFSGIVVAITLGKAIYIFYLRGQAKGYNRFVYDYYGQYGKRAPVMIIRHQNDYIGAHNRQCDTFTGRLFFFRKISLINDPTYERNLELFKSPLPRDPSNDYRYMYNEHPISDREIAAAVNFSFKAGDAKKCAERTMRRAHTK